MGIAEKNAVSAAELFRMVSRYSPADCAEAEQNASSDNAAIVTVFIVSVCWSKIRIIYFVFIAGVVILNHLTIQIRKMNLPQQLAKHLRDVHFGGNWTVSNLKDVLNGITWEQAIAKVGDLNTIAILVFHINYFIGVASKVLEGGPLEGNDKLSFDHPPITSEKDWQQMQNKTWADAEHFANLITQLPEDKLWEFFGNEKYGTYYRNIQGIIEHTHYHLGQIALVKKMLNKQV